MPAQRFVVTIVPTAHTYIHNLIKQQQQSPGTGVGNRPRRPSSEEVAGLQAVTDTG